MSVCAAKMGFLLVSLLVIFLAALVKATHGEEIYFTNLYNIELLNNGVLTTVIDDLKLAEAIDCNICDQSIYWVEEVGRIKRGKPNNQDSISVVIERDLVYPYGLAVDWKGSNIYFSDRRGEGKGRIEVATCDGRHRKVLFHELIRPGPLAVNVFTGYLYFADLYDIYRADLNGENKEYIYTDFGDFTDGVVSLSVDVVNNVLFWTAGGTIKMLSLPPDGSDAVLIDNTMGSTPHGISAFNGTLYWTELRDVDESNHDIKKPGAVYMLDLYANTSRLLLQNDSIDPQDISSFLNIPVPQDDCADQKAGCEYFCFTVPDGTGRTAPECGCPTGLLPLNNISCLQFPNKFLLFTQRFSDDISQEINRTEIRQISLDIPGQFIDTLVPIDIPGTESFFLAFDVVDHNVYWTEVDPPAIKRAHITGEPVETFISLSIRHPEGIAIDADSRNLYWVDSRLSRMEVVSLGDGKRKVLLDGLNHPQGIALDVDQGYVYWTDLDADNPTVERARLDGSERQSLKDQLNYVPKTPTNIAVDPQTNYVYWADTDDSVDQISRFDGVTDQFLNIHGLHDVIGLAIEDYIYWTDRGNADNALVRANKTNGDGAEVILRGYPGLLGLTSVILDRLERSACLGNVECGENICLPTGQSNFVCACADNFVKESDTECVDSDPRIFLGTESVLVEMEESTNRWIRLDPEWNISASAIDVDYRDEMIYWIDIGDKLIYRQSVIDNALQPELVVTCCLETPEDLAVDWFGRNLYWTDSSRGTIEVAKLGGGGRMVLAKDLAKPSHISLDPTRGYLYWSSKSSAVIYNMSMDGSGNLKMFWESDSPGRVFGMSVNYHNIPDDILYWGVKYDSDGSATILKKELNSQKGVEIVIELSPIFKPEHMRSFRTGVYYSFPNPAIGDVIRRYDVDDGSNNNVLTHAGDVTDFAVMHHSLQPGIHECSVKNGGCGGTDALCLVTDGIKSVCECPATMAKQSSQSLATGLTTDTCISIDTFLLMATNDSIYYLPVPPDTQSTTLIARPKPIPVGPLNDVDAIAYDPMNSAVLWVDGATQHLYSATVDGSAQWDLQYISNVSAFSLAYDWKRGHVFLTETGGYQIELFTTNGDGTGSLLLVANTDEVYRPGDLVFDVNERTLYWTNYNREIRYQRLEDIHTVNTLNIVGKREIKKLTLEPTTKTLYWINPLNSTIESYDIASEAVKVIANDTSAVTALTATTIAGQPYLFWYNTGHSSIYRYDITLGTYDLYQQWIVPDNGEIRGFLSFERLRTIPTTPCLDVPRRCSHLCLERTAVDVVCSCPFYRTLLGDDKTCSDVHCNSSALELSCNDGLGCYSRTYYCDGIDHCRNKMDEMCECDTEIERGCSPESSVCYPFSSRCDGIYDCDGNDPEDEKECCPEDRFGCYDPEDGIYRCYVPEAVLCDGQIDCRGREDEMNCTAPTLAPSPSPTTDEPPVPTDHTGSSQIDLPVIVIIIIVATVSLLFVVLATFLIVRMIKKHVGKYNVRQRTIANTNGIHKMSTSPDPSNLRSESLSDYSEGTSMGTDSTHVANNTSPSSDNVFKRWSNDPSGPPPSLCQSYLPREYDGVSAISSYDGRNPPPPSVNYDAMSDMSYSVSRKDYPVAMNGDHSYHVQRGNPLMSRYLHNERCYYNHHLHSHAHPPRTHNHSNQYNMHRLRQQEQDTLTLETESTFSMATTAQTDNHDVFRYDSMHDVTPPGRPPSPATEISEHRIPMSPRSAISEYSV